MAFGLASLFLKVYAMGFYSLFAGLVLVFFEMPFVYSACIPRCEEIHKTFMDQLMFKLPAVRAVLHLLLSIYLFTVSTICIAAGVSLLVSTLLYIFAAINRSSDASDGLTTDEDATPSETGPLTNKFGTF